MSDEMQPVLEEWAGTVARELGIEGAPVDIDGVLALAGTAAHAVLRPAAPLTTYLLGIVVGRALAEGADPQAAADRAVAAIESLAAAR